MSHSTVRAAFRTQIQSIVAGLTGWTYIETVNNPARPEATDKWVTLEFIGGVEAVEGIGGPGNNLHRERGTVLIQLMEVLNAGNSSIETACDAVRAGFRQFRSGYVKCDQADPPITLEDEPWYRAQIAVPYRFDLYG